MRAHTIVYPGTFDPITKGHVDLAERAAKLFDTVVIGIGVSSKKQPLFTTEERLALAEAALDHLDNVRVECFSGLLTHFVNTQDSHCVLRGVRSVTDFEYESQLANMNRTMYPEFETLFLTPAENLGFISSSLVREIALMGGEFDAFVPPVVAKALRDKVTS